MKKLIKISLLLVAFFTVGSVFAANYGVIDMQQVVTKSSKADDLKKQLETQFSSQKKEIDDMTASLQADLAKYQKDKAVMSKKDSEAMQKKISTAESTLQQKQATLQQQVQEEQTKKMNEFMASVQDASKAVAKDKKLDLVLPKNAVVYFDNGSDVTDAVISQMKKS